MNMNSEKFIGRAFLSFLIAVLAFFLFLKGYGTIFSYPNTAPVSQTTGVIRRYVVYEGVFMKNEEVLEAFRYLRGETPPYENTPKEYHVTTVWRPKTDFRQFYGSDTAVHGYRYKAGEVMDSDGNPTANEGVLVTLNTSNPDFQNYIDSLSDHVWHITGSYEKAAKYTNDLDFSDGMPVSFTITGKFGAYMSDGTFVFSPEEADAFLSGTN